MKLDGVLGDLHDFFRCKHFSHVDEDLGIRRVLVDRV